MDNNIDLWTKHMDENIVNILAQKCESKCQFSRKLKQNVSLVVEKKILSVFDLPHISACGHTVQCEFVAC